MEGVDGDNVLEGMEAMVLVRTRPLEFVVFELEDDRGEENDEGPEAGGGAGSGMLGGGVERGSVSAELTRCRLRLPVTLPFSSSESADPQVRRLYPSNSREDLLNEGVAGLDSTPESE